MRREVLDCRLGTVWIRLDVAPRSWSLHRNQVLAAMTELSNGQAIRCIQISSTDCIVTYLALYVDDILIVREPSLVESVAQTLEGKWTTAPVTWVDHGTVVSFDGFNIEAHENGFSVHQRCYVKEILKQHAHVEGVSHIPCGKEVVLGPEESSNSKADLAKQAARLCL